MLGNVNVLPKVTKPAVCGFAMRIGNELIRHYGGRIFRPSELGDLFAAFVKISPKRTS
jgi:hypothetical protein